jgi:hypothetical protein
MKNCVKKTRHFYSIYHLYKKKNSYDDITVRMIEEESIGTNVVDDLYIKFCL